MAANGKGFANRLIAYAFTVGIVIALILGVISAWLPAGVVPVLTSILILMGIIVGFFNITPAEAKDYVLFVTALVLVIGFGGDNLAQIQMIGPYLAMILSALMAFIMPSVIIVGIKAIINLARD